MTARNRLIAAAIFESKPGTFAANYLDRQSAWKAAAIAVSEALAQSSQAFNRSEFLSACGLTVWEDSK